MGIVYDWFWHLLLLACVVWYSTITVYVSIRGGFDIRQMLSRLAQHASENEETRP